MPNNQPGPILTEAQRELYAIDAYELRVEGHSLKAIGRQMNLNFRTIKRLLETEYATRVAMQQRESHMTIAISRYEKVINIAFNLISTIDVRSNNLGSCLKVIVEAQSKIDEITGVKAPVRKEVRSRVEQIDLSNLSDEDLELVEKILGGAQMDPASPAMN